MGALSSVKPSWEISLFSFVRTVDCGQGRSLILAKLQSSLKHTPSRSSSKLSLSARMTTGVESAMKQVHDKQNSTEKPRDDVPIIDFAGIDGPERSKICEQIAEACETWGFFHLVNHGIEQSLMKRTKEASTEFFHGPEEEKSKIRVQTPRFDGWNHPKNMVEGNKMIQKDTVEHLLLCLQPEREENFQRYPQHPASYTSTLLEYTKELKSLGEKFMVILSEMLGLAPGALQTALTAGTASQSIQIFLRTNFYGLNKDGEALPGICHAHSDPGLITFLLADDAPGLEIEKDGRWFKVDPIPGGLICNVANALEVCSNGRYKSVWHKGMPCLKQERITLANFLMPANDAVIGPLQSLLDESHPPVYRSYVFGDYVQASVKIGLGVRRLDSYRL